MEIALLTLDIHLPYAHSLKDKRSVLRQLKDRLRSRFNVAVAEIDRGDLWQRAQIAIVTVNADHHYLESLMTSVQNEAERILEGNTCQAQLEFL